MGVAERHVPKVSVILPTYDRCEMVRDQLEQLTRQDLPVEEFEVIVADDGSSDGTGDMVSEFTDRLRLTYYFHEDRGNRVSKVRNAGAHLASAPILVFLDAGPLFATDFLTQHLALHADRSQHRAVVGYAYGYNPEKDMSWIRSEVHRLGPEEAVERYSEDPAFRDLRYEMFEEVGFDLSRRLAPWQLYFTINVSVRADDFDAVGGFDELFDQYWGGEDLEFGYKLFRQGVELYLSFEPWVVDVPHPRDLFDLREQLARQSRVFLDLYREPLFELGYALTVQHQLWSWNDDYGDLLAWQQEVADTSVAHEIEAAVRNLPAGTKVAVLGAGGDVPADLPPMIVMDFDPVLVPKAAQGVHVGHYALGLRTPLLDQSVDTVVLTSRLSGLWDRWAPSFLAEARRIGRKILVFADSDDAGWRELT